MGALFRPYVFGVFAGVATTLAFWLVVPLLLLAVTKNGGLWLPATIIIPPLIVGGFVSAQQMQSRHTSRYLFMGGMVGITVMLLTFLVTETTGKIWFSLFIVLAGGAVSMFGALLGKYKSIKYE